MIEVQLPVIKERRIEALEPVLAPAELGMLTERTKQALAFAVEEATSAAYAMLDTGALLIGLLRVEKGFAGYLLAHMRLTADAACAAARSSISGPSICCLRLCRSVTGSPRRCSSAATSRRVRSRPL